MKNEPRPGVTTCPICGGDVLQTEIIGRPRIYCSNKCRRAYHNRVAYQRRKEAEAATAAYLAFLAVGTTEQPPR